MSCLCAIGALAVSLWVLLPFVLVMLIQVSTPQDRNNEPQSVEKPPRSRQPRVVLRRSPPTPATTVLVGAVMMAGGVILALLGWGMNRINTLSLVPFLGGLGLVVRGLSGQSRH